MPDKDKNNKDQQKQATDGGVGGNEATNSQDSDGGRDITTIQNEIESLKAQLGSTVKQEDIKEIIEKLSLLTSELTEIKKREEERKKKEEEEYLNKLSETERLKYELKKKDEEIEKIKREIEESTAKKAKELEEKLKQYEEQQKQLAKAAAKAKALEAASRLGAYNPEQVYALIKDSLVTAPDGSVHARVMQNGEYVQIPVDEYLKDFLSRPENKNLLGTGAATGEGSAPKPEGTQEPAGSKEEREIMKFFKSLPPERQERIKAAADFSQRPLDEIIYIEYVKYRAAEKYKKKWQRS